MTYVHFSGAIVVALVACSTANAASVDTHRGCIQELNIAYLTLEQIEAQEDVFKSSRKSGAGQMALAYSANLRAQASIKEYIEELGKACNELR